MSVLPVGIGSSGGYTIANSLRFRKSGSAYLSRTFGSGNVKKWTFSAWVKRGLVTANSTSDDYYCLFGHPSQSDKVFFYNNDLRFYVGAGAAYVLVTSQLFRDPSAWYHIVAILDTDQAASSDRMYLFVNGVRITTFASATYPTLGYTGGNLNTSGVHHIGRADTTNNYYFDGYMADVYFLDGIATGPNDFGETNADGVWVPKKYTGTYGTNGFWLPFSDGTSATTLGYDQAGTNDWTPSGISTTAGVTYDWMTDTPTNNYAVLNPLVKGNGYASLSNGNLTETVTSTTDACARWSSVGVTSGKWYFEVTLGATADATHFGYIGATNNPEASGSTNGTAWAGYRSEGSSYGTVASTFSTWQVSGTVVQCAIDCDNGAVYFGNANTWINSGVPTSGSSRTGAIKTFTAGAETVFGGCAVYNSGIVVDINFGQRPFTYTPPTGFKALCTANLPSVSITNPRKHFDVHVRSGDGASNPTTVSGKLFPPELIWTKCRSHAEHHRLYDKLRGVNQSLFSSLTQAETTEANTLDAFTSDGYTYDYGNGATNYGGYTYVDWLWKANGAGVSNTDGSITSTVSANTTAGFSIVSWVGNLTTGATVGHGLGVKPKLIIFFNRSIVGERPVYSEIIGAANYLYIQATNASAAYAGFFNNTEPTSSVFTLGNDARTNGNTNNLVAYCFAEVPGFSKFGSYTGNGSADGPFVFCGFRPRYLLVKLITAADGAYRWYIVDAVRNTYNVVDAYLFADFSAQEQIYTFFDFTANGFKIRSTGSGHNYSGATYIYAAFSEMPTGGMNVAPAPAR